MALRAEARDRGTRNGPAIDGQADLVPERAVALAEEDEERALLAADQEVEMSVLVEVRGLDADQSLVVGAAVGGREAPVTDSRQDEEIGSVAEVAIGSDRRVGEPVLVEIAEGHRIRVREVERGRR